MTTAQEPAPAVVVADPISQELGRAIRIDEVTAFAKASCGTCRGTGKFKQLVPVTVEIPCGCAVKRFNKAHPGHIRLDQNRREVRWLKVHEPPAP